MNNILAQITGTPLGRIGDKGDKSLGPFGNMKLDPTSGIAAVTSVISSIIGLMTAAASIWFLFNVLYGGYEWLSSGGDAKKLAGARDHITHAFIGLVIVVGAWSLLAVAGKFFGFDTLINTDTLEKLKFVVP